MLFSVVVPLHNCQKELPDCILSVLRQSFRDLELILVNAGSRDDTFDCCRRFANIDSRIRILQVGDVTAFEAKKEGVERAQGEYVTVLFPDGTLDENLFSGINRTLKKGEYDLVAYAKNRVGLPDRPYPFDVVKDRDELRDMLLSVKGINQHFVGFFYRRELYQEAFSYFHEGIRADEDDLLIFASFVRAKGLAFCKEGLYRYLGKVYFPRPHGWGRVESEEYLFQRLNNVVDDHDCSFARQNIARHAFLTTVKELRTEVKEEDEEGFADLITRLEHSAFFYALKELDENLLDEEERLVLKAILAKNKRSAYKLLKRAEKKGKK